MRKLLIIFAAVAAITTLSIGAGEAAQAYGTPLQISIACAPVAEGAAALCKISKSGGNGRAITIGYSTADGTAKSPADYAARSGSLYLGSSPVSFSVPTVDDALIEGNEAFAVKAAVISGSVRPVAQASVVIVDNDIAPPPPPAPIPAPAPAPPPAIDPAPSPPLATLAGLPPIPSEFDISLGMHATGGTGVLPKSAVPDVVGAFRFICQAGQVLADDPIVYPGQPGKSHLHQFYGNTSANAFSTYPSLRQNGESTCNGGPFALNRSAYWMPAMLNGLGWVVRPDYVSIYYKRRPQSDPKCSLASGDPNAEGNCVPLPAGLKFIFGHDMLSGEPATGAAYFDCDGPSAKPGHYPDMPTALANCPAGNRLGALINAPECWNGRDLDSANHRDHMAYRIFNKNSQLVCPPDHPYVIAGFKIGAWYSILAGDDTSLWSLSSDAMFPNLPKGSTLHGDWFGAWDPGALGMWHDNCINKMLNCSAGDLGNGRTLNNAAVQGNANPRLVPVPAGM